MTKEEGQVILQMAVDLARAVNEHSDTPVDLGDEHRYKVRVDGTPTDDGYTMSIYVTRTADRPALTLIQGGVK